MGFLAHFKSNFDLKANHEFNLEIKVDLKSTLISNKQFLSILETTLILKATWIIHRYWIISHTIQIIEHVSLVSSEEGVNIIISNDSLVASSARWKSVDCLCEDFQYQCCIFSLRSRDVPWFVLLSKLCLWWEVISLISHAFKLTLDDVEHLRGWRCDI